MSGSQVGNLVILGAGAAGSLLALELSKQRGPGLADLQIILIDNKEFHEYTPSIINVLLQPTVELVHSRLTTICPKLRDMFRGTSVKLVQGAVDHVTASEVILSGGGQPIPYKFMFICTGSSYSTPFRMPMSVETVEQRFEDLMVTRRSIDEAGHVLCIGGGPVGVEMAGELASRHPEKKVTLVNSQSQLLSNLPNNLGEDAHKGLMGLSENMTIILDEKIDKDDDGGGYTTSKTGTRVAPDHTIMCVGNKPNSQLMNQHYSELVDDRGLIKVNAWLQVEGLLNVYAVGDVSNFDEPKLYYTAHMQAMYLARAFPEVMGGASVRPYGGARITTAVSLGHELAIISLYDGLLSIKGIRRALLGGKRQAGSRVGGAIKTSIEKASLNHYTASLMNQFLYYTGTK